MSKVNRGKQFEQQVREAFMKVPETTVIRIPDQTMRYKGATNVCDFIVYHYPYQYFIECKSIHGNTFPLSNITKKQWEGLLNVCEVEGVKAGVMCWYVDKDITKFYPIKVLLDLKTWGFKSVHYEQIEGIRIKAKKKRVLFDYNMEDFFNGFKQNKIN